MVAVLLRWLRRSHEVLLGDLGALAVDDRVLAIWLIQELVVPLVVLQILGFSRGLLHLRITGLFLNDEAALGGLAGELGGELALAVQDALLMELG